MVFSGYTSRSGIAASLLLSLTKISIPPSKFKFNLKESMLFKPSFKFLCFKIVKAANSPNKAFVGIRKGTSHDVLLPSVRKLSYYINFVEAAHFSAICLKGITINIQICDVCSVTHALHPNPSPAAALLIQPPFLVL